MQQQEFNPMLLGPLTQSEHCTYSYTLDGLLETLQALKNRGVPGSTPLWLCGAEGPDAFGFRFEQADSLQPASLYLVAATDTEEWDRVAAEEA